MEQITKWFQANKLSLNVEKIFFIVLGGNKKYCKDLCKVIINETEITQVTSVKFLGVLVDEKINWKEHINLVCNKMARSLGVIRKISGLVNQDCLLTLYFSLIYPHLTYCNIVWASTYDTYLHSIYLLQKKCVRTITHSKRLDHSAPLFKKLKLFTIFQINTYQICTFIHKIKHTPYNIPKHFSNYFQTNNQVHNYNTRRAQIFAPLYIILVWVNIP